MASGQKQGQWYGRLLCLFGWHDYEVIEVNYRFADGGCIEKLHCKRCGKVIVRNAA